MSGAAKLEAESRRFADSPGGGILESSNRDTDRTRSASGRERPRNALGYNLRMPNLLRNILAVVAGVVAGSIVNGALISVSATLIPPPPGVDIDTAEGLAAGIHLFEPRHFVIPFLAHALGTLVGALVAYLIATRHKSRFAYGLGVFFLLSGIAASYMIPAPAWFIATDILFAYLPMAWLAVQIGRRVNLTKTAAPNPAF